MLTTPLMTAGVGAMNKARTTLTQNRPANQSFVPLSGGAAPMGGGMGGSMGGDTMPQTATTAPATGGFQTSGAKLTPYGPGNDLQGTAILPSASPMTSQAQGYAANAAGQVAGQSLSPYQTMTPFASGNTAAYQNIGGIAGRTAGTTNPTAAYGLMNQAQGALTSGPMAQGMNALIGLSGEGGGFSYGGPQADVGKARGLAMSALDSAMSGPDRAALASQAFDLMAERSQSGFDRAVRDAGRKAAALGRAGSGMVNTDLADVTTARATELDRTRRDMALDAAQQTLADRAQRTQLAQGVAQGFAGDDRADAGLNLSGAQLAESARGRQMGAANSLLNAGQFNASMLRGLGNDRFGMDSSITGERGRDADRLTSADQFNTGLRERQAQFGYNADRDTYASQVGERDSARADEYNQGGFNLSRLSGLSGYAGGREAEDRMNRGELRDERGFQTAMAGQAVDDQYRSAQFDEWLRNSRAGRMGSYAGIGYGNDPSGAMANAAQGYQAQASGALAGIGPMAAYLAQFGNRGAGGAPRPVAQTYSQPAWG